MTALLAEALRCFGLPDAHAEFIRHNENLTYCVDNAFLLRIHRPAPGVHAPCTLDQRRAELAFLRHLRRRSITVQEPVRTPSGEDVAVLRDGTAATLLRWLPGRVVPAKDYDESLCHAAGKLTARLHQAAAGFTHPALRRYDAPAARRMADQLEGMAERHRLGSSHADALRAACEAVARRFETSANAPIAIHNDLSPSNILHTESGPAPIDFSLCGTGLPMTDLGMLLAGLGSTAQRAAAVCGYEAGGGVFRHGEMEAGFIFGLLGAFVFHADTWPQENWFAARLLRWERQLLLPFIAGQPILDRHMNFIHMT